MPEILSDVTVEEFDADSIRRARESAKGSDRGSACWGYGTTAPGKPAYPELREIEVGQSFVVMAPDGVAESVAANSVRVAFHNYAKKSGKNFTSRKIDGGVRVWRIE